MLLRAVLVGVAYLVLRAAPASAQSRAALVAASPQNLLSNGGFEAPKPAYWESTGAGATWSTEQARTPAYSLKLSGSGEAAWTMSEAIRNWVAGIPGDQNPAVVVGAYVRTEGVNTNPTSDAEKFQLVFEFFDAAGEDVLGGPVVLDVPQAEASSDGWVELSSATLGAITFPSTQAAKSARISFRKGASATGTVYLDDVWIRKEDASAPGWAGGFFNPNMDLGDTWYYYYDHFDTGERAFPEEQSHIVTVTDEAAHTGTRSLKIERHNLAVGGEAVAISERVAVGNEPVLVSFWLKTEGVLHPDSIGTADYNLGIRALFYENLEAGVAGYGQIGEAAIRLNGDPTNAGYSPRVIPLLPRQSETGWTQYAFVFYPQDERTVGMEVRLSYWHHFEGTTYWDDVFITPLGGDALVGTAIEEEKTADAIPQTLRLRQNYPNPFNPVTNITFDLPVADHVTLEVYNLLGQRVATLVNGQQLSAGTHTVRFDGSAFSSGLYLYVLKTGKHVETRSMVLLK